jgi:hypothetical protein
MFFTIVTYTLVAAVSGLLVAAIRLNLAKGGGKHPASGRKSGAEMPPASPSDTPATPATDDLGLYRQLLALKESVESLERRVTDLNESTNRRFGRLDAAQRRGTLAPQPEASELEDDETLPLPGILNGRAAPAAPGHPTPTSRRRLVPVGR